MEKNSFFKDETYFSSLILLRPTLRLNTLPSKLPAQIALFSLIFFGTMIFWQWEAMLISYLATKSISLPFKDITDLVVNTEFRIIFLAVAF